MINPSEFYRLLKDREIEFLTGVPDSLLKAVSACFTDLAGRESHIIAANEGNAVGIAAGYNLSTGKIPMVYMQNSGLGNAVNPLLSLSSPAVYGIPMLLLIGWRGEPGVKDEPQHIKQGELTLPLLDTMQIPYAVLSAGTDDVGALLDRAIDEMRRQSGPFALVVRKNSFEPYQLKNSSPELSELSRERAISLVAEAAGDGIVLSTTGHISRELYEYRKAASGRCRDFLNVGSMGHVSQIALGVALARPEKKVFCLDGDGATIMHMGGMGIIASRKPKNYHHVIFNNGVHGSVGGQPTIGAQIKFADLAGQLGYCGIWSLTSENELIEFLQDWPNCDGPTMLEIRVGQGARKDLGRPVETTTENKAAFIKRFKDTQ